MWFSSQAWDDANAEALRLAETEGLTYVPPFDHPLLWYKHELRLKLTLSASPSSIFLVPHCSPHALPEHSKPAQAGPRQHDRRGCGLAWTRRETWSCGDICGWRRPPLRGGPGPPGRRLDRHTHHRHGDSGRRLFQCSD